MCLGSEYRHDHNSCKPSIPDGFEKRNIGGVLNVDNASAHHTATPETLIDAERRNFKMNLRLSDRRHIPVHLDRWVRISDDWLRVTLRKDGFYYLESKSRKVSWRMQNMP